MFLTTLNSEYVVQQGRVQTLINFAFEMLFIKNFIMQVKYDM